MSIEIVQRLSFDDAQTHLPMLESMRQWIDSKLPNVVAGAHALEVVHRPTALGVDASCLVLVLPSSAEPLLEVLCTRPIEVRMEDSEDLLDRWCILSIGSDEIRINVQLDHGLSPFLSEISSCFFIGLAAGNSFWLCKHDIGEHGVEELVIDLQVCSSSSGINYNPYRIWNEEELEEARIKASCELPRPQWPECPTIRAHVLGIADES